jgi:hypothetical protein
VNNETVDHAVRVLRATPGHTLAADRLHERVVRETGLGISLPTFIVRLRSLPARFLVLPPQLPVADAGGWNAAERLAYAAAFSAVGVRTVPIVTLSDGTDAEPLPPAPLHCTPRPDPGLAEVHRSVREVLRATGSDAGVTESLGAAVADLDAASAVRERGQRRC